jgi:hypothetical protein
MVIFYSYVSLAEGNYQRVRQIVGIVGKKGPENVVNWYSADNVLVVAAAKPTWTHKLVRNSKDEFHFNTRDDMIMIDFSVS